VAYLPLRKRWKKVSWARRNKLKMLIKSNRVNRRTKPVGWCHAYMKQIPFALLMMTSICATERVAAEPVAKQDGGPPVSYFPTYHLFTVADVEYATFIEGAALAASPEWDLDKCPPISFKRVVEISREEHRKLVNNEPDWQVRAITVRRVANPPYQQKWYYEVSFRLPKDRSVNRLVDFSGKPGKSC
jgi:hypothetical protein